MEDLRTPGRDLLSTVPSCPDHAGRAALSQEDTSRLVDEDGVWLWRRTGWCITYECGCRLEFQGAPVINKDHPILRSRGDSDLPLDVQGGAAGGPG
jgi:hypothetical protein